MTGQSRPTITRDEKKRMERLIFRMTIPLDVILTSIRKTLGPINEEEKESDILLNSLPRIDRKTLNQGHDCPICDRAFNPPAETSPTLAPIPTPLQLPCSHIICGECIETWLSKAGSCPMCRCTLTSKVFRGGDSVADMQTQLRVVFCKVLHCGQEYLETKPPDTTFGGMWEWARNGQSEEQRRTWKAMRLFQDYRTKVEHDLLLTEGGQAVLAGVWDACGVTLIYPERAQGSEQNENESVANVVGETWAVVGEQDSGESEDAWASYGSEIDEY